MEGEIGLMEALGVLSAFGIPGGGDILDPLGIGKNATQLDLYDDTGKLGGYKPSGRIPGQSTISKNLGAFKQGFDTVVDPRVAKQTKAITAMIPQGPVQPGATKGLGLKIGRFAGDAVKSKLGQAALKYLPAVGTALSVGDLVLGDESLANKGMDTALMAAGGFLGSAVPVVGTALGATGGKMLSDGIQFVFGGGKSPEERKLEEALAALQGGRI